MQIATFYNEQLRFKFAFRSVQKRRTDFGKVDLLHKIYTLNIMNEWKFRLRFPSFTFPPIFSKVIKTFYKPQHFIISNYNSNLHFTYFEYWELIPERLIFQMKYEWKFCLRFALLALLLLRIKNFPQIYTARRAVTLEKHYLLRIFINGRFDLDYYSLLIDKFNFHCQIIKTKISTLVVLIKSI